MVCFAGLNSTLAQTRSISGKVTDQDDGTPIPGVSVVAKGTSIGTITDFDGNYTLNVLPNVNSLVFSFVGMKTQEVALGSSNTVNVAMKSETVGMDEVIVTAYGTQRKEAITGAVSAVNAKAIESRPVSNVSSVLEGKATGVMVNNTYGEPGSSPTVRIRGFTSVNGNNSPLYVVDGVAYGGNVSDLNPQDIESISVLKDASSATLFGSRASNGVVMITTKQGRSTAMSMRANVTQGFYTRGMAEYDKLGPNDFMEVMWKGHRNNLMTKDKAKYPTFAEANPEATSTLIPTYLKYNIYNKPEDALFDADGKLLADAKVLPGYDDLDWFKYIERVGHRQDYSVSGEGSTAKSKYFFSAGYLDEQGFLKASDFKRFTGRTNVSVSPKEWIKTGLSLSGSHQISNQVTGDAGSANTISNPFYFARVIAPIYPVFEHDMATGDPLLDEFGQRIYNNGAEFSRPQFLDRHIVWESELNMDRVFRNTLQSQAFVDFIIAKDFTLSIKGDISLRNSENQTYNNATIGDGAGNSGRAKRVTYRNKTYTFQQQLTWKKELNDHDFDVFLGHENFYDNEAYAYGYKTNEIFEGGTEMTNFTIITSLLGTQENLRMESYLSRARYNYKERYFFETSFRRDGTSRLSKKKRWGNFWSLGGSWSISKEPFMAAISDKLNVLKLRASYGEVGNDISAGLYAHMALYDLAQNANMGAVYKIQNEAPDLMWETLSSFGTAIEGRAFDRANFTFEYFDRRSKKLLFDVNLPLSSGATSTSSAEAVQTANLGVVSNRGFEMAFDVDVIHSKDWTWNLGLNASWLKNEIITLPEQNREFGIVNGSKKYMEGHGIYDFWMYQFVGVDQMTGMSLYLPNYEDYYIGEAQEGKSELPAEYVTKIGDDYYTTYTTYSKKDWSGSAIPDVFGSVSSSLRYKNFDLSVLCTYSLGGKTLDYSYQSLMSVTSTPSAIHKDVLNSWDGVPDGMAEDSPNRIKRDGIPTINYGMSTYTNGTSSRFLKDASYFVVKNVNLTYNFPKVITNRLDISGLGLNFGVENLATFTKLKGMNPQQSYSGINDNAYVTSRVFSIGVNVTL